MLYLSYSVAHHGSWGTALVALGQAGPLRVRSTRWAANITSVEDFPNDVRSVFRALAEARDGAFCRLWTDLLAVWPRPMPTIEMRSFQVADSTDAYVALGVEGDRPDGCQVRWGVSLRASTDRLVLHGTVEVTVERGDVLEVFTLVGEPRNAREAADQIDRFAEEVCAQRSWMEEGRSS